VDTGCGLALRDLGSRPYRDPEPEKIADSDPEPFIPRPETPLGGVRALGFSHVIAGPGLGRALAYHGADVLNLWTPNVVRGNEPRAKIDADRAQHQRRCDAASIENAARGNNGDRRHGIDNLRHQRHRANLAAISARLATLRDDHVDTSFSRLDGLRDRSDLQHYPRADSVRLPHQIAGIAEREGDDSRPRLQGIAKGLCIQGLRDVIDRKGAISECF
jgi:hypothetical protein